jgi:hypothetical protein
VIAFLEQWDLSNFDAKNPPPQTDAWRAMVSAGCAPEESEMVGVLDRLGRPAIVSLEMLTRAATPDLHAWLIDRRNRRRLPYLLEDTGYMQVRSRAKDGYWQHGNTRVALYGLESASEKERQAAVTAYVGGSRRESNKLAS